MKTFRIVYLPHHREDKEWIDVQSVSERMARQTFQGGPIISIKERVYEAQ